MTAPNAESPPRLYGLLITLSVGLVLGRILGVQFLWEPDMPRVWPATRPTSMPTFSSNDRSRWATVRALVEEGTFVVGRRDKQTVLVTAVSSFGADPLAAAALERAGFQVRTKRPLAPGPQGADRGIVFEDGWETVDKVLHPERL